MIPTSTKSPASWRTLLASPSKHWRKGYSAMSLAYCWEQANGFPKKVKDVLDTHRAFKNLKFLLAIPEYKVDLPGGRAASQNDLFVLARSPDGLVVIMVEGKVKEVAGKVTDNPDLESEGKAEGRAGKVQEKVGEVKKVFDK